MNAAVRGCHQLFTSSPYEILALPLMRFDRWSKTRKYKPWRKTVVKWAPGSRQTASSGDLRSTSTQRPIPSSTRVSGWRATKNDTSARRLSCLRAFHVFQIARPRETGAIVFGKAFFHSNDASTEFRLTGKTGFARPSKRDQGGGHA